MRPHPESRRRRTHGLAILLLAAAAAPPLCAAEPPPAHTAKSRGPVAYVVGRANDLLDVFELNAGIGHGAKLDLKYGLQFFGLGEVRSRRVGTIDRRAGVWRELDDEFGFLPLSFLAWPVHYAARLAGSRNVADIARFVAEAGSDGFQHLDRKELNGDPAFLLKDTVQGPRHARWGDSFPIGAEIHAGVGVRAMVRPLQLVDFLVGFVGVDLDPWLARNPFE